MILNHTPRWSHAPGNKVVPSRWQATFGGPLYPDTPSQLIQKLIASYNSAHRNAPLPPARLHDLRHVHATTLLLAGAPVHVVAARLGHADPSVTLRVYAHVIHEETATVADTFARLLQSAVVAPNDAGVSTSVSKGQD